MSLIVKDKLFTLMKDKNDLYYISLANVMIWRLLERWKEATRNWTNRHTKEQMKDILKFMKLCDDELEFELETELWLAKEDE